MIQKSNILILIFFIFFITSCYKEINLNLDQTFEKQIVVNSIIYPDTNLFVYLTYTKFLMDTSIYFIPNAKVEISDGDTTIQLHYQDSGLYVANYKPQIGKQYYLRVEVGDTILTAHTYIPADTPMIKKIYYTYNLANIDLNTLDKYMDLYIILEDPHPGRPDYYEFFCQDSGMYPYNSGFSPVDENYYYQEGYIDDLYPTMVLSDNFFPRDVIDTIHLRPNLCGSGNMSIHHLKHRDSIVVTGVFWFIARKVSVEYYNYMKSLYQILHYDNNTAIFNSYGVSLFFKPTNLYTNIQNGLGIFAGFNQTVHLYRDTSIFIVEH